MNSGRSLIVWCALSWVLVHVGYAAFETLPAGVRMSTFGSASFALSGDLPASLRNPGLLSSLPTRTLTVFHSPGAFGLTEMQHTGLAYCETFGSESIAGAIQRFGCDVYSETTLHGAFSAGFGNMGSIGISVRLFNLAIKGYGSDWGGSVSLGALVNLTPCISYGVALENVYATTIGESEEAPPHNMGMSLAYEPLDGIRLMVGAEYDLHHPVSVGVGCEYRIMDVLSLKGGLLANPDTYALGCGIKLELLEIEYSARVHSVLGLSHMFGATFTFR
jgi:hypothetical protein